MMKNMKFCFTVLFAVLAWTMQAAVVDSIKVFSNSMNKEVKVVVIKPSAMEGRLPVIYLLHGHGGNEKQWLEMTKPDLPQMADRDSVIFVCPDAKNSWYWDSPKNPAYRYETFVYKELVTAIDTKYPTIKDRSARAITGFSMGGHGAMWLAFRHKDVFGAVGSMSGGLDIRPFPNNWNMSEQLGTEAENQSVWDSYTAISQICRLKDGDLAIIFDCGYGDFFFEVNNNFHQELLKYKINHDFIVRPGNHTHSYWNNSLDYQLLFFKKFFNKRGK